MPLFSLLTAGVIPLIALRSECDMLTVYIPRIETLGLLTMGVAIASVFINLVQGCRFAFQSISDSAGAHDLDSE